MSHRSTQVDSDQSDRALRIQRVVDDCLAEQFLRRRQAACDDGFVVMGLHWFARGLEVEPSGHDELRTVIAENLTQWGRFGISECVSYFSSDRYAGLAAGEEPGTTANAVPNSIGEAPQ